MSCMQSLVGKLGVQKLFLIYTAVDEEIIVPKLFLTFSRLLKIIYQQDCHYIFIEILSFADRTTIT